jgi:hypothetical protein
MTQEQMESACKKVVGSGWTLRGTPTLDKDQWTIPFRHDGLGMQTFIKDREVTSPNDETSLVDEIERAVGWAIASSQ